MNLIQSVTALAAPRALLRFAEDPIRFLAERHAAEGEVICFQFGREVLFSVRDPMLARKVLKETNTRLVKNSRFQQGLDTGILASEPPLWDRQHDLMVKMFASGFHERLRQATQARIQEAVVRWQAATPAVELESEFLRLTFDIITESLFGLRVSEEGFRSTQAAITTASQALQRQWLFPWRLPRWLPTPNKLRLGGALDTLNAFCASLYEQSQAAATPAPIQVLLNHNDRAQAIAEIKSLLIAGHETVAQGLTWMCALLAFHPEWQSRLREHHSQADEFSSLAKRVIRESLRLYPPIWLLVREPCEDYALGSQWAPKGSQILMSTYLIQRHPGYWSAANEFQPDRFEREEAVRNPAYLPFGFGSRMCLGMAVAQEQAAIVLHTLLRESVITSQAQPPLAPHATATLRPHQGFWARIERAGARKER